MKSKKRLISILLGIVLLVVLAFSSAFIIAHAHHDCSGADCPICALMHMAEQILNGLKAVLAACAISAGLHFMRCKAIVFGEHNIARLATLIDLKVKLSN